MSLQPFEAPWAMTKYPANFFYHFIHLDINRTFLISSSLPKPRPFSLASCVVCHLEFRLGFHFQRFLFAKGPSPNVRYVRLSYVKAKITGNSKFSSLFIRR